VIPEPLGGAHNDAAATISTFKGIIKRQLEGLQALSRDERLKGRYQKFRDFGHFTEPEVQPA